MRDWLASFDFETIPGLMWFPLRLYRWPSVSRRSRHGRVVEAPERLQSLKPITFLTRPRADRSAAHRGTRSRWYSAWGRASAPNRVLNWASESEVPDSPM